MKERPILFNGSMVRAILNGTKTQTRRPVKSNLIPIIEESNRANGRTALEMLCGDIECPYGSPGDRLWVREHHARLPDMIGMHVPHYFADGPIPSIDQRHDAGMLRSYPSIHMPRWASRITLEITSVRVERLKDISEEDAQSEGVYRDDERPEEVDWKNNRHMCARCAGVGMHDDVGPNLGVMFDVDCQDCNTAVQKYAHLWNAINGPGSWDLNPWVWVVEFKRVEG